jgi:hypothetical protein
MKKSDISGASVSLGESAVKGSIITSLDQSLQGRAAGVTAVSTSGAPVLHPLSAFVVLPLSMPMQNLCTSLTV